MSRDALVVGISTYQCLPSLSAPSHDAEAIAQRLQTDGDFRVVRIPEIIQAGQARIGFKTQVTAAELEAALVRIFKPKGNNIPQTAVFYFSGHGLQKDAGVQEGFLATSDANPAAGFYGLSLFWLRRLLQESPVRQRIVLLDCCHSGELLNFLEADPGARAGVDRLFMAASREYEAAYESMIGKYSVFTQALLDGLDPSRTTNGIVTNYALTDWVSSALKTEPQQPLFENSGSEIVLTRGQGASTVIKTELAPEICPYRGLEFFDEAHAEYFFGREALTDQLIEKLRMGNFVAIAGASGSGKSSLVRAGLIHTLRQGKKFSGSDRWRIQLISPTDQPLKSLATAFVNPKDSAIDRAEQLRRAELLLRDGGTGLAHLVRASLMSAKYGRNSRLLLIIDQFEEVFTLCQGPNAERDRLSFFNSLITALRELGDCFSVVVVLRADFFGKYSLYNGLAEQIERNLVTVTPLTYQQIKASIVKPAEKAGIVCEPNLIYNILLDIVGAPGELPLLQYTLLELWQQRQADPDGGPAKLTLDTYNELGGVRGTLQKRANETFYSLTLEEQRVAKRIFIALTQIGDGTEDTRRRIAKSELVSPWFPIELVERVLEKLVTAKLIITNRILASGKYYQERSAQNLANVSSALRVAQMRQGKFLHPSGSGADNRSASNLLSHVASFSISSITQRSVDDLAGQFVASVADSDYQETVEVAHEALIRNWSLLRTWLDENRELLQRQRRIEHAAREWQAAQQSRSPEYLLHGDRLTNAEDHLIAYPDELSALAQRYIAVSREENRRAQKEMRLLQLAVPCTLLVALIVTFSQYRTVVKSQAEKDYQLQIATSRQQAAVAQSILQEPDGDPTAALLISRLAAEKGGYTYEAQASLRMALQKLRLQSSFQGHRGAVHQVAFSPDQRHLATAGADGTVRIWSLETQQSEQVLSWYDPQNVQDSSGTRPAVASAQGIMPIAAIAFSPNGKQLAAIAQNSPDIQIWSVESGKRMLKLSTHGQSVQQLVFSANGDWIAARIGNVVQVWDADNGELKATLRHTGSVKSLAFSPANQDLLTASGNVAQLWKVGTWQNYKRLQQPDQINSATFSPTGQLIATGGEGGNIRLWQASTGQLRRVLTPTERNPMAMQGHNQMLTGGQSSQSLQQVLFSPDGQFLATTDATQVWLWKVTSGQLWSRLADNSESARTEDRQQPALFHDHFADRIAFSPDSHQLVTADHTLGDEQTIDAVRLWDVQTGRLLGSLKGHSGAIESVRFNSSGSLIATASADGSARLWATEMGSEFPTLKTADGQIQWAAFRRMTQTLQSRLSNTAALISPSGLNTRSATNAAGSEGASEMMTVAIDGTIRTWHPATPLSFSNNSSPTLASDATTKSSGPARLTGLKSFNFLRFLGMAAAAAEGIPQPARAHSTLTASEAPFSTTGSSTPSSSFAPNRLNQTIGDGSLVDPIQATAGSDRLTGKLPISTRLTSVAFSSDTQFMATADAEGSIDVWQVQPNKSPQRLRRLTETSPDIDRSSTTNPVHPDHATLIRQLAFSSNGQMLLGVGSNQLIYLWDARSGKLVQRLQGHGSVIEQAQFSTDGQQIVSASRDHTARIWQVASGQLVTTLNHRDVVSSARFSPDGRLVATASWDGTARIFDPKTGALRVIMAGHRGAVLDAEFNPDASTLVTASADGTVRLWDVKTGTEQSLLQSADAKSNQEQIQQAFFSPDGRYVASLSKSGQLQLWAATWEELLNIARDRSLRQLQPEECLRYLRLSPNSCPTLEARQ